MSNSFVSFVARRYLRSKRKEVFISIITVISVLGVAVSVMVLDIVLSIMTGFETELQAKLLDTSAHITVRRVGGEIEDWQKLQTRLEQHPEVVQVEPYTYNQALLSASQGAHGLLIRGLSNSPKSREKLQKVLEEGTRLEDLYSPQTIDIERPDGRSDSVSLPPLVVGRALRQRLGLSVGQPVMMLSPQMNSSPQGLIPRTKRFLVVGSYSSGMNEYENGIAYTTIPEAQKFFQMGNRVSGIEIHVKQMMDAAKIATQLSTELGDTFGPLNFSDWTEPNRALWEAIRLEKRVYFIVLLLLILVASFSIVSTLVMVVMEKSRDIALLKTMGATDSQVLRIFLLQGALIGTTGTLLGTVLGYIGCVSLREFGFKLDRSVFALDNVPVHMEIENFLAAAIASFFITTLAGLYPARRASKLQPVDALRFE